MMYDVGGTKMIVCGVRKHHIVIILIWGLNCNQIKVIRISKEYTLVLGSIGSLYLYQADLRVANLNDKSIGDWLREELR